jgi:Cu/Ag efflux pump CusA
MLTPEGKPLVKPAGSEKDPTEGERKAATLMQRLRGSQAQLSAAIKTAPDAAKPGVGSELARKVAGDTAANLAMPEARQQVEAAQLDMLDAALTLATGAAYTKEQLQGHRRAYFPQIGDDKKTVADKQVRLKNVISAAEIAAGRAAKSVPKFEPSNAGGEPFDFSAADAIIGGGNGKR